MVRNYRKHKERATRHANSAAAAQHSQNISSVFSGIADGGGSSEQESEIRTRGRVGRTTADDAETSTQAPATANDGPSGGDAGVPPTEGEGANEVRAGVPPGAPLDPAAVRDPPGQRHDDLNDVVEECSDRSCTSNNEVQEEECYGAKKKSREYWPPHALKWFQTVKDEIVQSLKYTGKGIRYGRFQGTVPDKYKGITSPSDDPVLFFPQGHVLSVEDFCLPDLYVWWPEAKYHMFYPDARTCCRWHKTTECVAHDGWMDEPRHGHTTERMTGILGRRYYCSAP